MNFKNYILLEIDYMGKYSAYPKIHIRVKKGTTSVDMKADLKDTWTPDKKDRVYFFPGCTVPRFKVREKFSTTIKPEYATAAFISPTSLQSSDNMFDVYGKVYTFPGEYLLDWFEAIYGADHHFVLKYKSILLNCEDAVVVNEDVLYKITHYCPDDAKVDPMSLRKWRTEDHSEDYGDHYIPSSQEMCFYVPVKNSALSKLTCPIYAQDEIIAILNEDNIIIDKKKYQELRLMANSEDPENIILVMELMANANYAESFVYLLLLLQEFNIPIQARRKEVNHVNFKSLLHFLDLDERKTSFITIEMMMTGMKKHKQFTRANLQRVSQYFGSANGGVKSGNMASTHFTTGPILREEYETELDDYELEEDLEDENFNL